VTAMLSVRLRAWMSWGSVSRYPLMTAAIAVLGSTPVMAQESTPPQQLIDNYCVKCHDQEHWKGGLALDAMDPHDAAADPDVWEKVARKLRTGMMPPAGEKRPDKAGYESLISYLETRLDAGAAAHPNPGRPSAVHRLNRTEYINAIRDLLALEVDGESLLPADEAGAGFDNNAKILSLSAMLMERYLIAARQISRTAVGDPTLRAMTTAFETPKAGLQADRESENLPFGSRGGLAVKYGFPLDGDYTIKIRLQRTKGIEGPRIIGLGEPRQLDVRLDGKRIKLFHIGGEKDLNPEQVEEGLEVRFPAKAGTRLVGVTFLDEDLVPEGMLRPLRADLQEKGWGPRDDSARPPGVELVSISGPQNARGATTTASRSKIFACRPKDAPDEERCATQILSKLARQAYRRPVTAADVDGLLKYYKVGRDAQKNGNRFEEGVRVALEAMLTSPDFLFRIELDPPQVQGAAQSAYRISDLELASRLSFFLWSSIPDEELLDLAAAGQLQNPQVLQQQVQRMLADSRSKTLADNFFGQWFGLRAVKTHMPDVILFPDFDDDLREAFEKETDLLFSGMLREDRSVLELLSADYTYVNERLARHYGIPNVYGSQFRRVTLEDENRWGVLGKGAVLMITSLPNRTSVVLRGKWILDNILGAAPPPPPPGTPAFPEDKNTDLKRLTSRQKLEQHRTDPKCSVCHSQMDPLGFAFESFDAVGEWRKEEAAPIIASPEMPVVHNPVDASGVLPDGTRISGPAQLRKALLRTPESFVHIVTDRLLTYALGRELDYYDAPAIRKITHDAAAGDYRWSSIILGIVNSTPFQMRAPAPSGPQLEASEKPKIQANLR